MRTLLSDTAHQITLLEQGVIPDSLRELRADCEELIRTFEAALTTHQLASGVILDAVRAQCALLDEAVARNLPQEMQALWENAPLQRESFCHGAGSTNIFARMVTQLQAATPELALLECYSTILELGLQGCHTGSDEFKVEPGNLLTALYTKSAALRQISDQQQHLEATERAQPASLPAPSFLPSWLVTTLIAAAIVLLYLLLNHALDQEGHTRL